MDSALAGVLSGPWVLRGISLAGLFAMMGLAWAASEGRGRPRAGLVLWGLGLQFVLALIVLRTPGGRWFFDGVKAAFDLLTEASGAGAGFVFGNLSKVFLIEKVAVPGPAGLEPQAMYPIAAAIAFQVLPVIIFVSAVSAVLQHLGVIQALVRAMAWLMQRTLGTSGAETFYAALQVFTGIESATAVRGYLERMTRSELFVVMVTFLSNIAASVMVAYANFGAEPGHLLSASLMSAPAALIVAKLLVPETGTPETATGARIALPRESHNVFDAAAQGAAVGLSMALNVGAMLIVFVGLIHLGDRAAAALTGQPLVALLAYLFYPFAWLMGIAPADVPEVAELLATKSVFNEFLAYQRLQPLIESGAIAPRSIAIATYALCGFANPGSLGILLGALGGLLPGRRAEIAALTLRAYLGGTLAIFMTACVAGLLL